MTLKLDAHLRSPNLRDVPAVATAAEDIGFDALWTTEGQYDAYLPLAVAASTTNRIKLGTAVALAFTRSPMVTAYVAWDLQRASDGRFILGLGTQVRGHIERRFSVKWESPGPKLREAVRALRAIWECWQSGTPLNFQGRFYSFTLMIPFVDPGPLKEPNVPVYLAGVNPFMCAIAGEVADGIHLHPLHSARYVRETVLPSIAEGAKRAGRDPKEVAISALVFVATGQNDSELRQERERVRELMSFYASTKRYRVVMDLHGWGEVSARLTQMAAAGRWKEMPGLITDEMLEAFAIAGLPDEIGPKLTARYGGVLDRVTVYKPYFPGDRDAIWRTIVRSVNG